MTAPAEMTSCSFLIDSPDLAAAAQASAVAAQIACAMKLLMSLRMMPCPAGPAWKMFSQNAERTGLISAKVASSAPTMMLSLPSSASTGVRASGASMNFTPSFASASRVLFVVAGSLVDVSMTMSPSRATLAIPSAPNTFSSTCGAPVTHRNTMSDARVTSAVVFASFAPLGDKVVDRSAIAVRADGQRKALGRRGSWRCRGP